MSVGYCEIGQAMKHGGYCTARILLSMESNLALPHFPLYGDNFVEHCLYNTMV